MSEIRLPAPDPNSNSAARSGDDLLRTSEPDIRISQDAAGNESWHGVASEDMEEVSYATGVRLHKRSRALLCDLLRGHRLKVVLLLTITILEQAAYLAGPLIVAYAINISLPSLAAGNTAPLVLATTGYLGAGILNALSRAAFTRLAARISQAVLLDLRCRVFDHAQALSLSFHESYTSGRIISRATSDIEALQDLALDGLEDLATSMLSIVVISATLFVLDVPLALIALAAFLPILALTRWFQVRSRKIYRRTRTAIASVIVHLAETLGGIRAVQALRAMRRSWPPPTPTTAGLPGMGWSRCPCTPPARS